MKYITHFVNTESNSYNLGTTLVLRFHWAATYLMKSKINSWTKLCMRQWVVLERICIVLGSSRKKSNLCKGQSNLEEGAFAFAAIPLAYYKLEAPTNHSLARQQKSVCVIKEGNKSEWINLSNETQLFLLLDS